jgi:hypothetical protein
LKPHLFRAFIGTAEACLSRLNPSIIDEMLRGRDALTTAGETPALRLFG